jgi:SH3-like domain-containing protein
MIKMRKTVYLTLLWLFSTLPVMSRNIDLDSVIVMLKGRFAPDGRVEIFDIEADLREDTVVLRGETTCRVAYEELIRQAGCAREHLVDNIRLLPDGGPDDATWGVFHNSVGTLRAAPRYDSELVSQALLGMPVRILERRGGWRRVRTPDRYIGWVNGSVTAMTKSELQQYLQKPKVTVTSLSCRSLEKPDGAARPVFDLVAGNMLEVRKTEGEFYLAVSPDGREAYVRKQDAMETDEWLAGIALTGESVVNMAHRFAGIPYLWGGTSAKGMDCSGFTKTVYFMHGVILARDASQQALNGRLTDSSGDFDSLLPGDLLFFGTGATADSPGGGRVVHVGIYIGNRRFIHASDYIRIGSTDPEDPLFDEFNTNRYLYARRIIGEVNTPGIEAIFENEFYRQ